MFLFSEDRLALEQVSYRFRPLTAVPLQLSQVFVLSKKRVRKIFRTLLKGQKHENSFQTETSVDIKDISDMILYLSMSLTSAY